MPKHRILALTAIALLAALIYGTMTIIALNNPKGGESPTPTWIIRVEDDAPACWWDGTNRVGGPLSHKPLGALEAPCGP